MRIFHSRPDEGYYVCSFDATDPRLKTLHPSQRRYRILVFAVPVPDKSPTLVVSGDHVGKGTDVVGSYHGLLSRAGRRGCGADVRVHVW